MTNYEDRTVDELKDECRRRDIIGYSDLKKDELVQALQDDDEGKLPVEGEGEREMGDKDKNERGTRKDPEGQMPEVGEEGGVVKEGTGDFAPGTDGTDTTSGPQGVKTVEQETKTGQIVQAEVGADGEGPVTPQNPPAKALIGGGRAAENDTGTAEPRQGAGEPDKSSKKDSDRK